MVSDKRLCVYIGVKVPYELSPTVAAAPPPLPEPEEKKENTAPKKYVPPAQRNAAVASPIANPISRRGNKKAPNIQSEEDFPTLGMGPQVSSGSAWYVDVLFFNL